MLQHVYNWIPWPAQIRQFRQTHFSRVDWTYKTQVKGYQSVCCWFFLIAIFSQNPNSVLTTPNRNKQYHGNGFFFGPGRCRWEEHCWEDDPALHIFARGDEICKYFGECLARVQEWASAGGWGCSRSPLPLEGSLVLHELLPLPVFQLHSCKICQAVLLPPG